MRTLTRALAAIAALFILIPLAFADDALDSEIRSQIEAGHRQDVVNALQQEVATHPDHSMAFFRLGLLSPRQSGNYLRDAGALPDQEANEERLIAMTRYYIAAGQPLQAIVQATRHAELFPHGAHADEAQYLLGEAQLAAGKEGEAERRFDWLSRNAKQPWRGWGLYGQGEAALRRGDTSEALRLLKQAATMNHHPASAPALLVLGNIYDARGKVSDAFRYLSMYREAYPNGILPLVENAVARSDQAEAAAGLTFTIQVGVFGENANVEQQQKRFKALGYTVKLVPKTVAGNHYTAVWVGRFKSREAAMRAREKLEKKYNETYRVVVYE